MLKICKVDPAIVDHSVPNEIDRQHGHRVERIKQQVKEEVRQPEGSRWNSRHQLEVFALEWLEILREDRC